MQECRAYFWYIDISNTLHSHQQVESHQLRVAEMCSMRWGLTLMDPCGAGKIKLQSQLGYTDNFPPPNLDQLLLNRQKKARGRSQTEILRAIGTLLLSRQNNHYS
jgi:hypothetical protein